MISPVKIWRNQSEIRNLLGIEGSIVSWTKIIVPPAGFTSQAPYIVVLVKLATGRRLTAQLVDFDEDEVKIGLKIITVLRKTVEPEEESVIPYGIKCKPVTASD